MRRAAIIVGLTALVLGLAASMGAEQTAHGQTSDVRAHVRLQVLGSFPEAWIQPIARALERQLEVQVTIEPQPVALPSAAYYEPRRRYRAERLTDFLGARIADTPRSVRVLGLTARDISTTREPYADWGILGLADPQARAAVVSSFRMRRRARDATHAEWRMTTTAVHEVGHLLGLEHCTERACLMRDAEGTMDTVDQGDGELGPGCRARLDRFAPVALEPLP